MKKCVLGLVCIVVVLKVIIFVDNWFSFNVDFGSLGILAYSDKDVRDDKTSYSAASFTNYSDSLRVKLLLREMGYAYPYAGVEFVLEPKGNMNFSGFDFFEITLRAKNVAKLNLYLKVEDGKIEGYRHLIRTIEVSEDIETYEIALESFRTPLWWLEEHNSYEVMPDKDILRKVKSIQIEATDLIYDGSEGIIVVKKIEVFSKKIILAVRIALFIFLVFIIFAYLRRQKRGIKEGSDCVAVAEKMATDYIGNNYYLKNISTEKIAMDTGLKKKDINRIVKKISSSSPKSYINEVRLEESARLLRESDRNVSEIAYIVGFKNVSHFNRSFKACYKCSPTEYRKKD